MTRAGLTLIEVLITLAILGVMVAVILSFQTSTLQTNAQFNHLNLRMTSSIVTLNYLADHTRAAVLLADNTTTGIPLPGGLTCQRGGTNPCLAMIVPVTKHDSSKGKLDGYFALAFRFEPRSSVPNDEKRPDPHADADGVLVLREYRAEVTSCSSSTTCPPPTSWPTSTLPWTSDLLADGFTLEGNPNPFDLTGVSTTRKATLRLRSQYRATSGVQYYPRSGPREMQVFLRNH